MQDDKRKQAFPRDRKGEIFQDDLGEDHTAFPPLRDDAAHDLDLQGDQVDSQEGDEFMTRRFGKGTSETGSVEKPTSENQREQPRK